MKKFWKIVKLPLIVGLIAAILYCIDSLLGKVLVENGSFMWVAFASWTIFFGVKFTDRIKALIGNVIGYSFGVFMFHASGFFAGSIIGIPVAGILFVFIANGVMMLFAHTKKIWLDSIPGIFMGVFLCFSGVGVKLYPTTWENAFLQLGIILIYSTLGLICGFMTNYLNNLGKKEEIPFNQ